MVEEQKWPTTAMALSWSTRRLATATACFGSQASSALTSLIFSPLIPPAALMSSAAWGRAAPVLLAEGGVGAGMRSGHAVTTSASACVERPITDETASRMPFSEQLLGHGVLLLRMMLALVTTMLLLCFAHRQASGVPFVFPEWPATRTLALLSVLSLLLEISHLGISPNPLRRATAQASQGLNRS